MMQFAFAPRRRLSLRCVLQLLLSICCCAPALAYDHAGLALKVLEGHILPGYRQFADASKDFAASTAELCAAPSPETLARARTAARHALYTWGAIEHIRFGPITKSQRIERLLFYPDTRGIGRKQIARMLHQHDRNDLAPEKLAHASVAVQGFSALDYVLFAKGSDTLQKGGPAGSFRCAYVRALADGIASIAADASSEWAGPYKEVWLRPGPDNKAYLTPEEPTQALLRAYVTELEIVRLQRLGPALGADPAGPGHAKIILSGGSLGLPFMIANIQGIRHLLVRGGFLDVGFATSDQERSAVAVLGSVATDLGFAVRAGEKSRKIAADPFADDKARAALTPMLYALENSEQTGRQALTTLTGQPLGFNSLDGD
jgi:predicted lipoprotein